MTDWITVVGTGTTLVAYGTLLTASYLRDRQRRRLRELAARPETIYDRDPRVDYVKLKALEQEILGTSLDDWLDAELERRAEEKAPKAKRASVKTTTGAASSTPSASNGGAVDLTNMPMNVLWVINRKTGDRIGFFTYGDGAAAIWHATCMAEMDPLAEQWLKKDQRFGIAMVMPDGYTCYYDNTRIDLRLYTTHDRPNVLQDWMERQQARLKQPPVPPPSRPNPVRKGGSVPYPYRHRVHIHKWTTVKATGVYLYQVCDRCGRRRVESDWQRPQGYQPIDEQWLRTGEWTDPNTVTFQTKEQD